MTAYWTTLGLSGPPCSKEVEDPDLWLPCLLYTSRCV